MTVDELRRALDEFPDYHTVLIETDHDMESVRAVIAWSVCVVLILGEKA